MLEKSVRFPVNFMRAVKSTRRPESSKYARIEQIELMMIYECPFCPF